MDSLWLDLSYLPARIICLRTVLPSKCFVAVESNERMAYMDLLNRRLVWNWKYMI